MALIGVEPDARQLADAYREAERRIVERIAAYVADGLDAPTWEYLALQRAQSLREHAVAVLRQANVAYAAAADARVTAMYETGVNHFVREVGSLLPVHEAASLTKLASVRIVTAELNDLTAALSNAVLRRVDDAYRSVVGNVVQVAAARGISRRSAAIEAMDEFATQGIGSFVDAGGRNWSLGNYVDMATRTGLAKAQNAGHIDAMRSNSLDLVIVQPGPRACETCDYWARSILSLDGPAGEIETTDLITGESITVEVDATLQEAIDDGFEHPNCRCALVPYLPGATDPSKIERPPWDEEGYKAQQQQRAIESRIREEKMGLAAAISQEAKDKAAAAVRDQQARLRDHLAKWEELKRRSDREQITGRFASPALRDAYAKR